MLTFKKDCHRNFILLIAMFFLSKSEAFFFTPKKYVKKAIYGAKKNQL